MAKAGAAVAEAPEFPAHAEHVGAQIHSDVVVVVKLVDVVGVAEQAMIV